MSKRLGKVISVVSPKGGVGKSTILTHLVTIMNMLYREQDVKIAVLDADFLQKSIYNYRVKELEKMDTDPKFKELVDGLGLKLIDVDTASEENLNDVLLEMKEENDYLFVDLPGTLINRSIMQLLLHINYILVPFYPEDDYEQKSTFFFLEELLPVIKNSKNSNLIDASVVLNRYTDQYDRMKFNPFEQAELLLQEKGFKCFKHKIYQRKEFQKSRSTIIPLKPIENDHASFYYIVQEFLKFIN